MPAEDSLGTGCCWGPGPLGRTVQTHLDGAWTVARAQPTLRPPRPRVLLLGRNGCDRVAVRSGLLCGLSLCRGSSREGNGTPLQYSCLENPMDGGPWWAAVHGVAKGQTRLSDFTFTFHFYALEKEMATHSSVLAWRIPGTGEHGGLPSMWSHRVRHD